MAIQLNHTIVAATEGEASARWFAEIFGTDAPERLGHFWQITTANGVGLDFASVPPGHDVTPNHYAFLVSEEDFSDIYGRIVERGMEHWPEPTLANQGQINTNDGGRGVYFLSNDGHFLEILTVPYGGW